MYIIIGFCTYVNRLILFANICTLITFIFYVYSLCRIYNPIGGKWHPAQYLPIYVARAKNKSQQLHESDRKEVEVGCHHRLIRE